MVEVSNAARVVFPEVGRTKGDVVRYYERIAPRLLAHVAGRPLSIRRFPKGLAGPGFFQKNVPPHYPESIARVSAPRRSGGVTVHPVVATAEHLAYLANQGTIELHVPTVTVDHLEAPDRLILDLDPPPNALALVRRAARVVRDALAALGVASVPVATGSKGYHVAAAIAPTVDVDVMAIAMQKLATLIAHREPDVATIAFRIALRGERVFLDFLRNMPHASSDAPYSWRARPRATVAAPLAWDELDGVEPDAFTIDDLERLLERPDTLAELAARPSDPAPFVAAVDAAFAESGLVLQKFDRFRS